MAETPGGDGAQAAMNKAPDPIHEMREETVHVARNASFRRRALASWVVTAALGGLFLGLIGATGSYDYPLAFRVLFWGGMCAIGGLFALAIEAALDQFAPRLVNPFAWWLAMTLSLAAAMIPVIFLANSGGGTAPIDGLPMFAGNSVVISGALVLLRIVVGLLLQREVALDPSTAVAPEARAKVLARLQPALRDARLIALQSEGHYVRIHTDRGDELVLVRLRDAIAETAPVEGMQVHRSWWVSREAVRGETRVDGKLALQLDTGVTAPVSRSFTKAYRDADW